MKIIAGIYRHRNIDIIKKKNIRPTKNIVREAIFNIIPKKNIENKIILDLFAGSGSLGIEAISRMAKFVYFVDINIEAIKMIAKNIKKLDIKNATIIKNDFLIACKYFKKNKVKFDLIMIDPPYDFTKDKYLSIFNFFKQNKLLNDKHIFVFETSFELEINDNNYSIKKYRYGKTFICIAEKN